MRGKEREYFLKQARTPEDKEFVALIFDKLALLEREFEPQLTEFLDPHQQFLATEILRGWSEGGYKFWGGFDWAERQRLVLYPDFLEGQALNFEIAYLSVKGNFKFINLKHRDILGSLMGLGIKRKKIGDILVGEAEAQLLVTEDLADYITFQLNKVHQVPVRLKRISMEQLIIPSDNSKELRTTVSSLRLDSVLSAAFGMSRSLIADEIKADKVALNWQSAINPASEVKEGDVFSLRGKGKGSLLQVLGPTKKGRIAIIVKVKK